MMKKVLINAYACCPGMGSEQGMAWNFITNIAKCCEVFVITEAEYQLQIEEYLQCEKRKEETEIWHRMHFYFVPIGDTEEESENIRKMCWNQGDWRFYRYYSRWQEKILPIAETVITENAIDIMHQLNMVGFREPGMLYKINERREKIGEKHIPLIWGPSAGFGSIPFAFMTGGGVKFTAFYLLKNFLNKVQLRWHPRVRRMVKESDALIAATPEMKAGFLKYYGKDVLLMSETGVMLSAAAGEKRQGNDNRDGSFKLLWVGRFMYTKQLPLALETMKLLKEYDKIELHIVGKAVNDDETEHMHKMAKDMGISDSVVWYGQIPNDEVQKLMRECDVFFFTSIFEATSTVVLEAITNNLPVVCFDRCGFGPIVDESIGRKIPCLSPQQAVKDFAQEIVYLYNNRVLLRKMGDNCDAKKVALSWDVKIQRLMQLYNS